MKRRNGVMVGMMEGGWKWRMVTAADGELVATCMNPKLAEAFTQPHLPQPYHV